jgi:hypothetical protein
MSSEGRLTRGASGGVPGGNGLLMGAGLGLSSQGLHYVKGETHMQLTQPLWKGLSPHQVKYIRIAIALLSTATGIFDGTYTGWTPYIWYLVDLCLLMTVITQWGLVVVHFFPFQPGLSCGVNFLLQITLPLQIANTLLYWLFFYTRGSLHWNDTATYVHPLFLYIVPVLLLIIELSLNQVIYNRSYLLHMSAFYVAYLPMTYIGKFALGYPPYEFLTWDNFFSYVVVIGLGLL